MRFGCCIVPDDYAAAVSAGFDYIELPGHLLHSMAEMDFISLRSALKNGPIPCVSCNSYCQGVPAMAGPFFSADAVRNYAERLCGRAARLGVKTVGIGSPPARRLPEGYSTAAAVEQCCEFLELTADVAAGYGISILFEQLNQYTCNCVTGTLEAARLVRKACRPNMGLVVDFYHRALAGEDVCDFTGFAHLVRHTHISTCGQSMERGYPGAEDLAYYTGILAALRRIGYDGTMSIEAPSHDLLREGALALSMLRTADREKERQI